MKATLAELWPAAAIAGGLYFGRSLLGDVFGDGMTDEQRAARAQTNGGAPVDAPGQALVGEPDYIKIYKGQKVDAVRRFGELGSQNAKAYPFTPSAYARDTVVAYWAHEINRLCGLEGGAAPSSLFNVNDVRPVSLTDAAPHPDFGASAFYAGLVNRESANAILDAWDRIRPRLERAVNAASWDAVRTSLDVDVDHTFDFWDAIAELAIAVDVDRAVPDASGLAWRATYEAALEAPGTIGDAVQKIAAETGGALWRVLGQAAINLLLSPVGLAAAGAAVWLYRAELGALARRL